MSLRMLWMVKKECYDIVLSIFHTTVSRLNTFEMRMENMLECARLQEI